MTVPLTPVDASEVSPDDIREQEQLTGGEADFDWSGVALVDCEVTLSEVGAITLTGARLLDSNLTGCVATEVRAEGSTWRQSGIRGGRVASAVLADAHLHGLNLSDARVGYLDLRSSELTDFTASDCVIETIDLTGASVERASFTRCRVGELLVQNATLTSVDLRRLDVAHIEGGIELAGSVIDSEQLQRWAPLLAQALGIVVADSGD